VKGRFRENSLPTFRLLTESAREVRKRTREAGRQGGKGWFLREIMRR
jgi:hypothetical protein